MYFVELHILNCPLTFYLYVISPMRNMLNKTEYETFNSNITGGQDSQIYGFL